jgi:dephospho-CoA kinase
MKYLGLTGDIACGKSTVARWLEEQGAVLIDADLLVRELYADPVFARLVANLFAHKAAGSDLLNADGSIDRVALGEIVFHDAKALRQLELIVHPAVAALREDKIAALKALPLPPPAVVLEAVKLIESGQAQGCDEVWCVVCDPEVQLQRLMTHRGLSEEAACARLANQPGMEQKRAVLGEVPLVPIPNNGSLEALHTHVAQEWQRLQQN